MSLKHPTMTRGILGAIALGMILIPIHLWGRGPVEGRKAMVVSANHLASQAGVEVIQEGGNAIDGAVATGFALAVVRPSAGNLGGGGFMIIHTQEGDSVALDFREVAPQAASRDMFLDDDGNAVAAKSRLGYLANGVPGSVAGLGHAWKHYGSGKISWHDILAPALKLAQEGFMMPAETAQKLKARAVLLEQNAETKRVFLRDGDFYQGGELFKQPDLAATLARIQAHGPREFYEGKTAELIAADQAAGGGLISLADLASYQPLERTVIRGDYRGHTFLTMPPPSSGGIALNQMLTMLEGYDLKAMGFNSANYIHTVTEVMRRAFHDRALHLGDPDYHDVPQAALLAPAYLQRRMADFDPTRASVSDELPDGLGTESESFETTHYSVVDAAGNAVACTTTLNANFGNKITVAGAGFLMNNEMDDFTAKVGVKNLFGLLQSEANAVEPGKRPLSSMTPTIVLKDGKPFLITGAPGGPTIITTVMHVMLNVIDHELPATLAVDAPRFHHQWQPDRIAHEPFFASPDTLVKLTAMGHDFSLRRLYPTESNRIARYFGGAHTIMIDPDSGELLGVSDYRNPDAAAAGF